MEHKVTCVLAMVLMLALSSLAQGQAETCTMTPRERINCGFSGITSQQCKERGCCFDDTIRGFPWCFQPLAIENPPEEECPF
ncbi:trefoil factor 1 [Phodopus roborovskii]|uniref:Tff1 protein n=1 Tax=Phodopus roborovskii TaxID=109678 RepID=A0AAU9ZCL6_PHORO|nr:trefoil factor 1 [Phodopus roborovskii]CAH6789916.1 Tff1 [Phodopus roborovskii]